MQKGVPVHAIAVKENALPAKSVSGTYFVFPSGRNQYSLSVVSINITGDRRQITGEGVSNESIPQGVYLLRLDHVNNTIIERVILL